LIGREEMVLQAKEKFEFEGNKMLKRSKLTKQRLDRWLPLRFGGFLQLSCRARAKQNQSTQQ
jgi:hypothetical protein